MRFFDVGINRCRELLEVGLLKLGPRSHIHNRMQLVEWVFEHLFAPMTRPPLPNHQSAAQANYSVRPTNHDRNPFTKASTNAAAIEPSLSSFGLKMVILSPIARPEAIAT